MLCPRCKKEVAVILPQHICEQCRLNDLEKHIQYLNKTTVELDTLQLKCIGVAAQLRSIAFSANLEADPMRWRHSDQLTRLATELDPNSEQQGEQKA